MDQTEIHERINESFLELDERWKKNEEKIDALVVERDELSISRDFLLAIYRGTTPEDLAESYERISAMQVQFDRHFLENDPDCVAGSEVLNEEAEGKRTGRAATPIARWVDKPLWNLFTLALKYSQQTLGDMVAYQMSTMIRSWDYTIREQLNEEEARLRRIWDQTQDGSFDEAVEAAQNPTYQEGQTHQELPGVVGENYHMNAHLAVMSCVQARQNLAELDRIRDRKARSWREMVNDNLTEIYNGKPREGHS